MLTITAILLGFEFICGAAGAIALGRWVRRYSFGISLDGMIGGIGGLIMVWLAERIPGVSQFVTNVETAGDKILQGLGGVTPTVLIGVGVAGLLGGILLLPLVRFVEDRRRGLARND
jgi:hypothetical protein